MLSYIRDIEALSRALAPALALASTPLNLGALALDGPPLGRQHPSRDEGIQEGVQTQAIEMQDSDAGLSRPMLPTGHGNAIQTGGVETCNGKRQRQPTSSKSITTQRLENAECLKF